MYSHKWFAYRNIKQFFPGFSTKGVLQVSDTFIVSIAKDVSKYAVIGKAQLSSNIPISHIDHFNSIGQYEY